MVLCATDKYSATCTCLCVRGHGNHENCLKAVQFCFFQFRAQKFLVLCESLVSVILRMSGGIFVMEKFSLDMAPFNIIKIIYFNSHDLKWGGFTCCKYLKC
jgi:hypothetical protein